MYLILHFPEGGCLHFHNHLFYPSLEFLGQGLTPDMAWILLWNHSIAMPKECHLEKWRERVSINVFKKLWHCSYRGKDILLHLAECLNLGFLFQKCLWFIRITIKMLMLHVQTVMILPSCWFNIQLSCVFSVSNTALEAKKDKSTDIRFYTRHLSSLC